MECKNTKKFKLFLEIYEFHKILTVQSLSKKISRSPQYREFFAANMDGHLKILTVQDQSKTFCE